MPKHRSSRRKGSRRSARGSSGASKQGPSDVALKYRGPIWNTRLRENLNSIVVDLFSSGQLTSSAGGIINQVFTSSSTSFQNFSTWAGLYEEFRILGIQLEFYPNNRYSKTTTSCIPGFGVVDHADTSALTSAAQALGYASCRILSVEDPWSDRSEYRGSSVPALRIRMAGAEEAQWLPTASTAGLLAIKTYFTGLTASTQYGLFLFRALAQFRGTG
jgi:hypothetical protein